MCHQLIWRRGFFWFSWRPYRTALPRRQCGRRPSSSISFLIHGKYQESHPTYLLNISSAGIVVRTAPSTGRSCRLQVGQIRSKRRPAIGAKLRHTVARIAVAANASLPLHIVSSVGINQRRPQIPLQTGNANTTDPRRRTTGNSNSYGSIMGSCIGT